jgi:lysophospholipase L1-like esterase
MASTNIDDSCLALGGATGFEVWQSLSAIATQLTADAWVLMSGVNDNYAPVGLTYVIMMMDIMHTRNPNSRIYVLNGVVRPNATYNNSFVDGDYWLPSFNQGLADSIRARQSSTYAIFQVNADSALCPGDTFSPTLMPADSLHPNQAGYDTLAKSIYSEMKKSVPPAMP